MKCLMCDKELDNRKGKVVCSTTCRVNKHKAMKECDKLLQYFLKDETTFKALYKTDNVVNRKLYRRNVIKGIVKNEGLIGEAWLKKLV
jgi:hypothetical protein